MKAMILAAGLGTRLHPLTENRPKALVEIQGAPLLHWTILSLARQGFSEVIVNAHHFSDQITDFLEHFPRTFRSVSLTLAVSREEQLLDTGGGVQNARWFLDGPEPFLVHNVDVLSDFNLTEIAQAHVRSGALATLGVQARSTSRQFLFDEKSELCGWQSRQSGELRMARSPKVTPTPLSFTGIQMLSPEFFRECTARAPFSLVEAYLQLAGNGHKIMAFQQDSARWADLGRPEQLAKACELFGPDYFRSLGVDL